MWLVRRIARRDQDYTIDGERLASLARNRQMAVMNGIECTAQQTYARRHSHLTGGSKDDKIVPMNDFLILLQAKALLDL